MPLLYLLPIISAIVFIVCVVFLVIYYKDKKKSFMFLHIFMLGTNIAFALIEAIIIYHYHGLADQIIKEKLLVFIFLILMNAITYLLKESIIIKGLKKQESDYPGITTKLNLVDPLNLIILIITFITFKI